MTMKTTEQLQKVVTESGFDQIKAQTHNFELMNMNKLFKDYPFRSLISNFTKNVITPTFRFGWAIVLVFTQENAQYFFIFS